MNRDARSLAGEKPRDTAIFLVAKDGDYVGLVNDLKAKGAQVYLVAPRDEASERLITAVGKKRLIPLALARGAIQSAGRACGQGARSGRDEPARHCRHGRPPRRAADIALAPTPGRFARGARERRQ